MQGKHLLHQRGACSPPRGTLRVAVNNCSLVNTEQCINEHLTVLLLQLFPIESPVQSQIEIILFLLSGELQKHLKWARERLGYSSVRLLCRSHSSAAPGRGVERLFGGSRRAGAEPPVLSGVTRQASPACRKFHTGFPHQWIELNIPHLCHQPCTSSNK